ncbi:GNAT family N-acetyltransferase [Haloferax sp. MBLA0076]|uniref:GNAT family N-acetyltransferase n=1 Tax=Haloferax litoreum TaxID=2666140 RepID=A0A6A8GNY3_9EURY|nr:MULTISPECIES: GNAT family N-acetyltransferase [Haloferax]KAB1189930.1 GNAT family N-acetyltransferase [Haloferax sp. CBA1148]MRX23700.1 GNAT family N-acetyltransferase [Haloferax litoreum]
MSTLDVHVYSSIDAVSEGQWNNVVTQSDQGSVFHRHEWLRAVEDTLPYTPRHVVVTKSGNPIAVFPNFVTDIDLPTGAALVENLGFVPNFLSEAASTSRLFEEQPLKRLISATPGYGGPVVTTDETESLDLMFDTLARVNGRNILFHTIKAKDPSYMRYGKYLAKHGYEPKLTDCRFELHLTDEWEDIERRMDKERRKSLRKAHENDVSVHEAELTAAEITATHEAYIENMERVRGHTYPLSFFETVASALPERMKIFVAEANGDEIGRYVHFLDDEQETMIYYFSAIGDVSNFDYYPAELLHEHAIKWGKENGYRYYDFGSTGSTYTDGIFKAKEKYGGRPVPTLQWDKGQSPGLWHLYKFARTAYRKTAY